MDFDNSKIEQAKAVNESLLEDPKYVKKKKRADQRRRRKYKFSDKRHSKRGIVSTVFAILSAALIIISIVLSVYRKGEGGLIVGILPFAALLLSTAGIILPCTTFRKSDLIFTFSWLGLIANIVIWLFIAFVLMIGL